MAHFLSASQLAEDCAALGLEDEEQAILAAAQKAAEAIAQKRKIAVVSDASSQPGFAGLCVGFGPAEDGQACPEDFADYDRGSDWAEGLL